MSATWSGSNADPASLAGASVPDHRSNDAWPATSKDKTRRIENRSFSASSSSPSSDTSITLSSEHPDINSSCTVGPDPKWTSKPTMGPQPDRGSPNVFERVVYQQRSLPPRLSTSRASESRTKTFDFSTIDATEAEEPMSASKASSSLAAPLQLSSSYTRLPTSSLLSAQSLPSSSHLPSTASAASTTSTTSKSALAVTVTNSRVGAHHNRFNDIKASETEKRKHESPHGKGRTPFHGSESRNRREPKERRIDGPSNSKQGMRTLVDNFTALASPRNGSARKKTTFDWDSAEVERYSDSQRTQDSRSSSYSSNSTGKTRTGNRHCPGAVDSKSMRPPNRIVQTQAASKVSRNRSNRNKRLSLNMSVIEDDAINGTVPPPAGDSTRSMQAACDLACSRVTHSIFVGGARVARDKHMLLQSGITHVLNCAGVSCEDYFTDKFKYRTLMLRDTGREDITPYLNAALTFILSALRSNGKIFIHCVKGISRSPAVTIAFLIFHKQMTLEKAHAKMKLARPISDPNAGFIFQLKEWAEMLPSHVLSCGGVLIYEVASPSSFSIRDRHKNSTCNYAATLGPLPCIPCWNMQSQPSDGRQKDGGNAKKSCYIVMSPIVVWLWHVKGCTLEMLRMAKEAAKGLIEIADRIVPIKFVEEGYEDDAFKGALDCALDVREQGSTYTNPSPQKDDVTMVDA